MPERATSLLGTVFQPVRSLLPRLVDGLMGGGRGGLPAAPHQNIPAINLPGVILQRAKAGDASLAADMYAGLFRFGGETLSGLPDTIFSKPAPSAAWRSALLRLDWLAGFRASGKSLHGLFALRLISAWVSARPHYGSDDDRIAALRNLAIDAPVLAASQSPAAIAVAQAAILQAWQPVSQIRPKTAAATLDRCLAQLLAHLACKSADAQRAKLLDELSGLLAEAIAEDGSHASGEVADAVALLSDLDMLALGLGTGSPPGTLTEGDGQQQILARYRLKLRRYLAMLTRPDGTLAFSGTALPTHSTKTEISESRFAQIAGHARLEGKDSVVLVAAGEEKSATPLLLEMHHQALPLFWLEARAGSGTLRRSQGQLICASGGSLLELLSHSRQGEIRKLSIFLAASGHDLRFEDSGGEAGYELWFPEAARLSTTNGGGGALLALGKLGTWQLLARNCTVAQEGQSLLLAPLSPSGPMNFALKLAEREPRRKSGAPKNASRLI